MVYDILTIEEASAGRFNREVTIDFKDLAALVAGNTASFKLSNGKVGTLVGNFVIDLETPFVFSDGSLVSCAITIGNAGTNNADLTSTELETTPVLAKAGTSYTAYVVATQINVYFTATAAKNLNTATAGRLHILFTEVDLTKYRVV
jgi:hypothetical protein